jgi:hypothetical protein
MAKAVLEGKEGNSINLTLEEEEAISAAMVEVVEVAAAGEGPEVAGATWVEEGEEVEVIGSLITTKYRKQSGLPAMHRLTRPLGWVTDQLTLRLGTRLDINHIRLANHINKHLHINKLNKHLLINNHSKPTLHSQRNNIQSSNTPTHQHHRQQMQVSNIFNMVWQQQDRKRNNNQVIL